MMIHAVIVTLIDSQVATDVGMGLSVSTLSIWIVEQGNTVSCVTAGAALAGSEGRTKPDGGRLIPGTAGGGRPVEHNTKTAVGVLSH